ncbi:hypothetical protein ASE67_01535 [Sphingomonas sp. Leaf23]|uniref:heparin lyase I family protein n=1 Tax=Sphingomonas sp. Leaf23 TaxID=1735689 RepID=UPI0006FF197F|nr:heparin lyase I family protein [Sphingomonas sp. Leaf23]KQM88468.1 hypothetical protein ASE67_01535 [Sphingomonas sp. Leaf23]
MIHPLLLRGSSINRTRDTIPIGGINYRRSFAYERLNRYQFKLLGDGSIARFELRDGDLGDISNLTSGNERSEVVPINPLVPGHGGSIFQFEEDGYLSFQFRIDTPTTAEFSICGQWHDYPEPDDVHMSPPLAFTAGKSFVHADGTTRIPVTLSTFFDAKHASPIANPNYVNRGSFQMTMGRWHRIVLHFRASLRDTGALELWVDGVKVSTHLNTSFGYNNDSGFGYWQWGVYRKKDPNRFVCMYANMELSRANLINRVANPLPIVEW